MWQLQGSVVSMSSVIAQVCVWRVNAVAAASCALLQTSAEIRKQQQQPSTTALPAKAKQAALTLEFLPGAPRDGQGGRRPRTATDPSRGPAVQARHRGHVCRIDTSRGPSLIDELFDCLQATVQPTEVQLSSGDIDASGGCGFDRSL